MARETRITVITTHDLKERVAELAKREKRTLSAMAEMLLEQRLDQLDRMTAGGERAPVRSLMGDNAS